MDGAVFEGKGDCIYQGVKNIYVALGFPKFSESPSSIYLYTDTQCFK